MLGLIMTPWNNNRFIKVRSTDKTNGVGNETKYSTGVRERMSDGPTSPV